MTRKDADYSDWGQIEEKNESIIDVLDKIRAEVADAFIKHGLGNTEICFDVLQIIDRKGEQHD